MKYTIEVKPDTSLDTKIVYSNDLLQLKVNVMKESYQSTAHQRLQNSIIGMLSFEI